MEEYLKTNTKLFLKMATCDGLGKCASKFILTAYFLKKDY